MPNTQSAKARALIDPDVLTLGRTSQRTRKSTNPVVQNNMSAEGPASPQPGLTPKARVFAKGGKARGNPAGKKMAAAALMAALTQPQGAPPGGAPGGPPMGAAPAGPPAGPPMGAPPGMKKGGHADAAQDKKLFGKMFKAEEKKEGPEKMKRGGHAKKKFKGADAEEAGESAAEESAEGEGMRRGGKYASGGKASGGRCAKCGGAMGPRHMCGGGKMAKGGSVPRHMSGRTGYAAGGVGKLRHNQMTKDQKQIIPKKRSEGLI